jgi:hypothetical protein
MEALAKSAGRADIALPESKEAEHAETPAAPDELTPGNDEIPGAEEINGMMDEIRRLSEDPERLLESHLGIFTEPAPPGKMLDSRG